MSIFRWLIFHWCASALPNLSPFTKFIDHSLICLRLQFVVAVLNFILSLFDDPVRCLNLRFPSFDRESTGLSLSSSHSELWSVGQGNQLFLRFFGLARSFIFGDCPPFDSFVLWYRCYISSFVQHLVWLLEVRPIIFDLLAKVHAFMLQGW